MKNLIKKIKENLGSAMSILFVAVFAILAIAVNIFIIAAMVKNVGGGSWVRGIVMFPFIIFGIVQFFRGALAILNKDSDKIEDHPVLFLLYMMATLAGYVLLYCWIRSM